MELHQASLHLEDITPVLRLLLERMDRAHFRELIPPFMVRHYGTNQRFVTLDLDLDLHMPMSPYQRQSKYPSRNHLGRQF